MSDRRCYRDLFGKSSSNIPPSSLSLVFVGVVAAVSLFVFVVFVLFVIVCSFLALVLVVSFLISVSVVLLCCLLTLLRLNGDVLPILFRASITMVVSDFVV